MAKGEQTEIIEKQLAELTKAVEKITTAVSCSVSDMLSPKEVSALTGLNRAKIRELEKQGWLRRHWPNAKKCYRRADVDACMRGRKSNG